MGTEPSVAVYDTSAQEWMSRRKLEYADRLEQFAARVTAGPVDNGPVADLGCGPGWHVGGLPQPVVALDASRSMLANVEHPLRVAGDLRALPFRDRCLRGAWASRSYIHLARSELPLALADLHRALAPGATVELHLFEGDAEWDERPDDDFPGRRFSRWPVPWLRDVLVGAGLATEGIELRKRVLLVAARRLHTLADTVLARGSRRRPGEPRSRPSPRPHRPRDRHDRSGETTDPAGRRVDHRRVQRRSEAPRTPG